MIKHHGSIGRNDTIIAAGYFGFMMYSYSRRWLSRLSRQQEVIPGVFIAGLIGGPCCDLCPASLPVPMEEP